MPEPELAAVRAAVEAFNSREFERLEPLVVEDLEIRSAIEAALGGSGEQTVFRGIDGLRELAAEMEISIAEGRFETEELIDCDGLVLEFFRALGVGRASGIPLEFAAARVWEFSDGRIRRFSVYLDRDEARRAAGIEPG